MRELDGIEKKKSQAKMHGVNTVAKVTDLESRIPCAAFGAL